MKTGYRESGALCPACRGELIPRETDLDSVIDVCKDCEGIWVDWFDGDLALVAADGASSSAEAGAAGPPRSPGISSASGCPRCRRPLVEEFYLGYGPLILRCGDCSGAFVSRGSALALLDFKPEERPAAAVPVDGFWKLVERIRSALGLR